MTEIAHPSLADLRSLDLASVESARPVHPGVILREDFMLPYGLTAGAVANALDLPRSRIERIVKEKIGISTDTAMRLARFFRTTPQLWLNLQTRYESERLLTEIGPQLERIKPVPPRAA